jgi:hypothetical protein
MVMSKILPCIKGKLVIYQVCLASVSRRFGLQMDLREC